MKADRVEADRVKADRVRTGGVKTGGANRLMWTGRLQRSVRVR